MTIVDASPEDSQRLIQEYGTFSPIAPRLLLLQSKTLQKSRQISRFSLFGESRGFLIARETLLSGFGEVGREAFGFHLVEVFLDGDSDAFVWDGAFAEGGCCVAEVAEELCGWILLGLKREW